MGKLLIIAGNSQSKTVWASSLPGRVPDSTGSIRGKIMWAPRQAPVAVWQSGPECTGVCSRVWFEGEGVWLVLRVSAMDQG